MSTLKKIEVRRSYDYRTEKPGRVYAVVAFGQDGEAIALPVTGYKYSGESHDLGTVKLSFHAHHVLFTVDEPIPDALEGSE